jgi:uncharacterized glyoxalase superfamily protein PhnB
MTAITPDPTEQKQTIFPMLDYEDAAAAIEFLTLAFGFEEQSRMEGEHGTVAHAELSLDGQVVMLSSVWRDGGFSTPLELGGNHSQLFCVVADVDKHCQTAREAGAIVIGEPQDQEYGYRTYRATDPEGHRWYFAGLLS